MECGVVDDHRINASALDLNDWGNLVHQFSPLWRNIALAL
jgi:hypothetical protein